MTNLSLRPIDPPAGLLEKVIGKIQAARLRQIRTRLVLAISGAIGSVAFVLFNGSAIWTELQQSDFFQMLRLFGSDPDVALANFKDWTLGLLESIPIASTLFSLTLLFCLLSVFGLIIALRRTRRETSVQHAI